jgi:hypothetical protein
LAKSAEPALFAALTDDYLKSGKVNKLWVEIGNVRRLFLRNYEYIQPLYQLYYWKAEFQDLGTFTIADKRFDPLWQFYVDCFETVCRLTAIVIGVEVIIHHKMLSIPTTKGFLNLDQLEELRNANKLHHIQKYPIQDLFMPVIDPEFRNGIGHHSAHYDRESDAIVLRDAKTARRVPYAEFCDKLIRLFSAFELAVTYYQDIHISIDGKFT